MVSFFFVILSALLSFLGFVYLAFGQSKHAKAILGTSATLPAAQSCQRWGWGFLILSFLSNILGEAGDFVFVFWPMLLSSSALLVVLILASRPACLKVFQGLPGLKAGE